MSELKPSPNLRARDIVLKMADSKEELNIEALTLENGTTLLDCGVRASGGLAAGRLFAEVCMGGLGSCELMPVTHGGLWMPGVKVWADNPAAGCMGCQYAGWTVKAGKYFAMGSGPARIKNGDEDLIKKLGYSDGAGCAVLALETGTLPEAEVAEDIAQKCGVNGKDLYLLAAPTASVVGSLQVASRVVETGMHKMSKQGFDITKVVSGVGACPVAPVPGGDLEAVGLTNDCVLYGGRVWYMVNCTDDEIEGIIDGIPSCSSRDYGRPFYDLYREYGDFYSIDPMLFSPAEIWVNNLRSGRLYHAGRCGTGILEKIFGKNGL